MAKIRLPKKPREGFVYFLLAPDIGRLKIGFSIDPSNRVGDLSTCSPVKLELLKTVKASSDLEQLLHHLLKKKKVHGEWFEATPGLLAFIKRLKEGQKLAPEDLLVPP